MAGARWRGSQVALTGAALGAGLTHLARLGPAAAPFFIGAKFPARVVGPVGVRPCVPGGLLRGVIATVLRCVMLHPVRG